MSVAQREDVEFLFNAGNSSFYMFLVFLKPIAFAFFLACIVASLVASVLTF